MARAMNVPGGKSIFSSAEFAAWSKLSAWNCRGRSSCVLSQLSRVVRESTRFSRWCCIRRWVSNPQTGSRTSACCVAGSATSQRTLLTRLTDDSHRALPQSSAQPRQPLSMTRSNLNSNFSPFSSRSDLDISRFSSACFDSALQSGLRGFLCPLRLLRLVCPTTSSMKTPKSSPMTVAEWCCLVTKAANPSPSRAAVDFWSRSPTAVDKVRVRRRLCSPAVAISRGSVGKSSAADIRVTVVDFLLAFLEFSWAQRRSVRVFDSH